MNGNDSPVEYDNTETLKKIFTETMVLICSGNVIRSVPDCSSVVLQSLVPAHHPNLSRYLAGITIAKIMTIVGCVVDNGFKYFLLKI